MDAVKAFTYELYSIMDMKPPISKAKMTAITRNAIKAIKLYKHVVQCVEKFIQKCKPEYKIPGLYVIDSIVRQSRHQFGNEKDVFAPRFARNLRTTFTHLFSCPEEDKSKVIRVLNLWQKNAVFTTEIIQPIFDLAANPDYEQTSILSMMDSPKLSVKTDLFRSQENTPVKDDTSKSFDALQSQNLENENKSSVDPAILEHIHAIHSLLKKQPPGQTSTSPQVKKSDGTKLFDKKILDYDYGDDEEEMLNQSPEFQHQHHQNNTIEGLDSLLSNPEVLRTLRNVEGLMSTQSKQQAELDKIKEMRKEAEFDKHLAQTVQNLPFASECELKPSPIQSGMVVSNAYANQLFNTQVYQQQQQSMMAIDPHHNKPTQIITYEDPNQSKPEVIDLDHIASPPPTKRDSKRDSYSSSSTRKRSPRKSSRERQREREKERDRDRERRKKYLPPFKKNHLAVVSTTLWVGHLSKLIHQDDLYGLFQPIGDIVSLNLISPRGCAFLCMNRRQDAARIMSKYQGERLQGKPMTIAWAPGQAMKDKEWKDYWEIDDGVSYIPWEKLNKDIDYDELEVGGMLDEDTMPEWLKTHLKNLRTSKKIEKKEEEKLTEVNQQTLTTSNVFDPQGVQSPSVQMQMSPAQNSQPNQMNFNMPQAMSMPNPFGINHRLINPMMNPMMPGTMTPMSMGHPSMMMMNRMPSPFGPPPNMPMMGNPQQMAMPNDAQKSLGVPPDMMMPFPFGMNLPPQAAAISSAQTMMGMNPPTVTSGTNSASTLPQNANQKDLSTTNPPNQLDPSKIMQFNLPPPPTLPNLSDFPQNTSNTNMGKDKYDPNLLGNSDHDEAKDMDRNNERDDRNRGRDNRNRNRDNRERNDRFKDRDSKMDRGRREDLSQRQDPRNRIRTEQRERKSSRWGDKVNEEEVDNQKNNSLSVKDDLGIVPAPNLAQMDNVKDILMQNNSIHQILEHVIQDNIGNPPFQPSMFGPNGPPPNQMFNMPPQGFLQDGPRPPHMDNGNMRGRGGWNRGGRGGFRGRGGYNNGPNWDSNNGPNWDNNSGPWDNNGPPPVWQNQSMNRGGMIGGRGNLRPSLMQNIMGRGRDNWMDNNSAGIRGGRDSDNWGGHGGGRDLDNKWGGHGGSRDSDSWGGRGNRSSPWRGNGNRRRNDDWDGPNQKRWRRDDNPEWDDQQKPWKQRGPVNEEEEWQNNKQGSSWTASKKDEGNYSKFKSRDNEERTRKPSKWGDKEPDDKVKEDRWNRKSVEHTLSKDETTTEEGPHQTSAPMDLDNYEGEAVGNIEQVHRAQELETSNSNKQFSERISVRKEYRETALNHHDVDMTSNYNTETYDQAEENIKQNVDEQHNDKSNKFGDYQHDYSNNSQELSSGNNEEIQKISESQPEEKFEQQNVEEKPHDQYNDAQHDSHDDFNTQCEYETNQNNRDFEQNQQTEYNDGTKFEQNQRPDYNQSFSDESSHKSNNQEPQECSVNNFMSQADETIEGRYTEDKPQESQGNFYFGTDSGSCINKSVELEQQNNEILPIEGTGIAPSDHNEVSEINTAESNQS